MDPIDGHDEPKTRLQATMDGQQVKQLQVKEIIEAAVRPVRYTLCKLADKRFIDEAIDKVELLTKNYKSEMKRSRALKSALKSWKAKWLC